MKEKRGNKRAQQSIGMSFGTIFSIFLIIFFVIIAFFVIRYFLNFQKCAEISFFLEDLQDEVDTAWNSEKSEFTFSQNLPSNLEQVCFANLSNPKANSPQEIYMDIKLYEDTNANLFFYPTINACDIPYHFIEHINIDKITQNANPYCFEILKGKVSIDIKKERGESLVDVS